LISVLAAQGVRFPCDVVQFQLLLHTVELLLQLELVQLLLRVVQLLRPWLGCQTGATDFLLPELVELPLCVTEFLGALEILKLFALGEFVDLLLLSRLGPRFAELIGRRPTGGGSQKKSGQQKTDSHGPAQVHRLTSCSLGTPLITLSGSRATCHCPCLGGFTSLSPFNRHQEADLPCRELPCLWSPPPEATAYTDNPGVSHLLHMAFFTGLYNSRGQPYLVNPTMQSRTCLQLAVLPHGAESRSCAWQRWKVTCL
jgi:hypothetical protein